MSTQPACDHGATSPLDREESRRLLVSTITCNAQRFKLLDLNAHNRRHSKANFWLTLDEFSSIDGSIRASDVGLASALAQASHYSVGKTDAFLMALETKTSKPVEILPENPKSLARTMGIVVWWNQAIDVIQGALGLSLADAQEYQRAVRRKNLHAIELLECLGQISLGRVVSSDDLSVLHFLVRDAPLEEGFADRSAACLRVSLAECGMVEDDWRFVDRDLSEWATNRTLGNEFVELDPNQF